MRVVRFPWRWLAAFLFVTPAWALFERTEERVLATGPRVQLHLDLTRGKVIVDPVAGAREVRLTIRRAFATEDEKEVPDMMKRHELEFTNRDGVVTLRSRYEGENGPHPTWIEWPPVDFTFELQVPPACQVTIVGGHTDAMIGPVTGNVSIAVETGELSLQQIDGSVKAVTKRGSITLSSCSGSAVLKARVGSVFAGPIAGDVTVQAGGGDAEVQAVSANTDVRAVSGDVKVGFAGNFAGQAKLTTDGGNVMATFDPKMDCRVDAGTFWGRVNNKAKGLAVQSSSRGRLTGTMNGGQWPVEIYAGGGDVTLKTATNPWKDAVSPAFTDNTAAGAAGR